MTTMIPPTTHPEIEILQRLHDAGLELKFLSDSSFCSPRAHLILSGSHHPVYEGAYRTNPPTSLYVKETNRLQFPQYHIIPGRAGVHLSLDLLEAVKERKASLLQDTTETSSPLQLGPRRLLQLTDGEGNMFAYSIYPKWTHRFFDGMRCYNPAVDHAQLNFGRGA